MTSNFIMIKHFIFSGLCILSVCVQAQTRESSVVAFGFGYSNYDVSSFESFIPSSEITLENHAFEFNVESSQITNRRLIGFDFAGNWQPKYVLDSFNVHISGLEYKLQLGYGAIMRPKFFMAPVISLDGGIDRIYMYNDNNTTAANIAADPGREINLRQGKAIADVSVRLFSLMGDETTLESNEKFLFGVRLGYRAHYGIGNWKYAKTSVSDGPEGFRQMIYGTICIGVFTHETFVDRPFEEGDIQ
ncbi:MAG TPA: hypothetical protein PKL06_10200 [Chitinophagales bacterium]|nr:hypothetical protein [Chitinophagales bacterium]